MKEGLHLLVFDSYNQSTLLYNLLLKEGCDIELVNTPCHISSGCSQSIRIKNGDLELALCISRNKKIEIKGIYRMEKKLGLNVYTREN